MGMWDLQVSIKAKLDANSTLTGMLANGADSIRDFVREDDAFPYIVSSEVVSRESDTMLYNGYDNLVSIHVYSRYKGQKEAKEIAEQVYNSLHKQDLTMSSGTHILTKFNSANYLIDADGETRHVVMNFKIVTEQ